MAVVDEEQEPGRRQALDQTVERGLRLGVDPVEVLEYDQEGLDLTLPQEKPAHGVERPLPPLGQVQSLPPVVLHRHVESARRAGLLHRLIVQREIGDRPLRAAVLVLELAKGRVSPRPAAA
jgi:hypothetical protein